MMPLLVVVPPRSSSVASSPSPKPNCGVPVFQSAGTAKAASFHVGPGSARVVEYLHGVDVLMAALLATAVVTFSPVLLADSLAAASTADTWNLYKVDGDRPDALNDAVDDV